jgi:peptidoglycan hydrolase-like protein with peptidoglycan-binding domain
MFNNEKGFSKADEQPEDLVEEVSVSVEDAAPVAEEAIEEVVVEQPVVEEAVVVTAPKAASAGSNKFPGMATLSLGQQNDSVAKVQRELAARGFAVTANGTYDRATENAVASFCKSKGLYTDGKSVGPRTWNHLFG